MQKSGQWIFFGRVAISAKDAMNTCEKVNDLFQRDFSRIEGFGRARFSCQKIWEYMKKLSQVTAVGVSEVLDMSVPTARQGLERMVKEGVLKEESGQQRDRIYVYREYLAILEAGAEPLEFGE